MLSHVNVLKLEEMAIERNKGGAEMPSSALPVLQ